MIFSKTILPITILVTSALGVTLNQFSRPRCYGSKRLCTSMDPGGCCQSKTRVFVSGSCTGCTSTDFHFVWHGGTSGVYCHRNVAGTNGGYCIGGQNLRGASWCRLCGTREPEGTLEIDEFGDYFDETNSTVAASFPEAQCTFSVEPNLATKDDLIYFKIGDDVPSEDNEALDKWLEDDEATIDDLPEHLRMYETAFDPNET